MNRFIFHSAIAIVAALSFLSCHELREDVADPLSEKDVYRTIGEEIPFETAMEWIEFYKKESYHQGRVASVSSYHVPAAQLETVLNSTTDLVGIALHHAIDDSGQHHIILIPVDGSMSLWSEISERIMVDANTGSAISQPIAYAWAKRYKNENPDKTWFHFFGKNIFDDMAALPFFNSFEIEPAICVLDLTPQLLLVVMNDELISTGRTTATQAVVYDASNACPPCAVK